MPGRRIRPLALALVALLLAGCDEYPAAWPRLDKPWVAACPDVAGTYRIAELNAKGDVSLTVIGYPFMRDAPRSLDASWWDEMTIAGDSAEKLTVTFTHSASFAAAIEARRARSKSLHATPWRPPTAEARWSEANRVLSDAEFAHRAQPPAQVREQRVELREGYEYRCDDGWLLSDEGASTEYLEHPRTDHLWTRRFTRDRSGGLVSHRSEQVALRIDVWCGDGCKGFDLGETTKNYWARVARIAAPTAPPPEPEAERPWTADFAAQYPSPLTPDGPTAKRLDEARKLIAARLPAALTLESVEPAGEGVRASVSARDADTLRPVFAALKPGGGLESHRLEAFTRVAADVARLQLWVGLTPLPPKLDREALRVELARLLPPRTRVEMFGTYRGGYSLTVQAPDRAEISTLLRRIATAPAFRSPDLVSAQDDAAGVTAAIVFADR